MKLVIILVLLAVVCAGLYMLASLEKDEEEWVNGYKSERQVK